MEWKKAPEELVQFLNKKMENVNCQFRKMFGYPAYFINGNMFAGVHGDKLFIRSSEADAKKIMKAHLEVTPSEPLPRRAMSGYVVLPKPFYTYVSSLPPKQRKK